ncbi:MAG: glycosyl transferase family protein, partial [Burkholderiaceae bacterium]
VLPRHAPLTEEALRRRPEQHIAVMLPAWDESEVIRPMLENALQRIDYANYTLFVGVYPNDADTQREVDAVCARHPRVEKVITGHDGPTSKADCLNWIFAGIRAYERRHDVRFEIFVMQDCEDVIHPLCYRLFNYLIPRKDMVQLPVESLETGWSCFTGGHYIDEFAQAHYKDMVVREAISGSIPAAGVGVAFSRRAVDTVCASQDNELFSTRSLTEDYEFGLRLRDHGLKAAFVRFSVKKTVTRTGFFTGRPVRVERDDLLCVREYFPDRFRFSVRQKSRWVLGITLQGWANLGWSGGLIQRYMLCRDRKSIVTNLLSLAGYLLVLLEVGLWISEALFPDAWRYPALVERDSLLWYLLIVNGFLFAERAAMRAWCVYRLYNLRQALLSFPRMILGNVINFLATVRAVRQYLGYLRTGKRIGWDKTAHHYPSEGELAPCRPRLGDLLVGQARITPGQLDEALSIQRDRAGRLGEILCERGWLQPEALSAALRAQAGGGPEPDAGPVSALTAA